MQACRERGFRLLIAICLCVTFSSSLFGNETQTERETDLAAGFNAEATHKADDGGGASSETAGGNPLPAWLSKLEVHGFLTQAYADASFAKGGLTPRNADELALGIPEDGTFDYRTLALQFRYTISPRDIFVVQFSSRELGDSPNTFVEDEIELDWAFYERRIRDNTSIKIGRVQIPIGIYNEIRDVGTILPFYRPPFAFYREGSFTSETIDGLVFSHTFGAASDWSLDLDLYGGEFETVEALPVPQNSPPIVGIDVALAQADDAYGIQLWLNTPVPGLRLGAGGNTRKVTEGLFRPLGIESDVDEWYVSVDATLDRWVFRSEFKQFKPTIVTPFFDIDLTLEAYYGQLGFFITDQFQIWLQGEVAPAKEESVVYTRPLSRDGRRDYGITFNYAIEPNVVFKAEYHETEAGQTLLIPVRPPPNLLLNPVAVKSDDGSYTIISLSVSF